MSQRILREWPEDRAGSHIRFRIVHRRSAAKARCWLEMTNQKRGGWFWVQDYYAVEVHGANVRVEGADGYTPYYTMPKSIALELADDIRVLLWVAA